MKMSLDALAKFLAVLMMFATTAFWVASCASDKKHTPGTATPSVPNIETPRANIADAAKTVGDTATSVGEHAKNIDQHTTEIETKTPTEVRPTVQPNIDSIRKETQGLREDQAELVAVQKKLVDTEAQLKSEQENVAKWIAYAQNADAVNKGLRDEIAKLKDENAAEFKRMMGYLAVICASGIGICMVVAFLGRSKTAIAVAVGFGITLAVSAAVTLYLKAIALVTIAVLGVAFLGVIAYMGWQALKNKKIEEELIQTGELTKQYLPPEAREHIFGYGAEPGKVDQIQTKATKERVKQVRKYNAQKQNIKLAPSLPEYWRPPLGAVRHPTDPYLHPSQDAYNYGLVGASGQRDTII